MSTVSPLLIGNPLLKSMFERAEVAMQKAHAPYSNFFVGCCIRTTNNLFFAGCNCENTSFGATICAEGGAITQMILSGEREIADIMIIANTEEKIPPCGICCQRISEHLAPSTTVHLPYKADDGTKRVISLPFEQLLPHRFAKQSYD